MKNRKRGSSPRVSKGAGSLLGEKVWAVIGDHYVNFDMTYEEARTEAAELKAKKQPGVVIVTNATAERMSLQARADALVDSMKESLRKKKLTSDL